MACLGSPIQKRQAVRAAEERREDGVLELVRVLELVHEHGPEAPPQRGGECRPLRPGQRAVQARQQVVKG